MSIAAIAAGAALVIAGFVVFAENTIPITLILLAAGSLCLGWGTTKKKAESPKIQKPETISIIDPTPDYKEKTMEPVLVLSENNPVREQDPMLHDDAIDGLPVRYSYTDVRIAVVGENISPLESFAVGQSLYFEKEPSNKYDSKAIAIKSIDGRKLGYLFRGAGQDMTNDYISADFPIAARISRLDFSEKKAWFNVWYYGSTFSDLHPDSELYDEDFEDDEDDEADFYVYKLVNNRDNETQDNIALSSVGSEVKLEFNYEKEKYEVIDGLPIGYLSKGANWFVEKASRATIESIELDESLKYVVKIKLEK